MSKMKESSKAKAWAPPVFPVEGRLPADVRAVTNNYKKHLYEENLFQRTPDAQGQHSQLFCCCHSLHISLFFDGTNNNDNNDTKNNHPSNIAKLFHASLQGTEAKKNGYFSYYMPGVGTPFPEIGELDYSEQGLRDATGGEDRINWALVSVFDALHTALNRTPLSQERRAKAVEAMSTWKAPLMFGVGPSKRRRVMKEVLGPLLERVERATPKVLGVKLFVYGFSRGAAEARTFVTWLSQLFETPEGAELPSQSLIGLPVSVEFLGVLDTVASVGIAHVAPFFSGHMDWADDTQLLPEAKTFPNFVKCCRHFVAAFEQRACFPLDSIRNEDGQYPPNTYEVVYPGVHSDVGGGYPQNDQGKARGGINELVSQIVLHDLYAEAFAAGAPLQVPEVALPETLRSQKAWRILELDTKEEFDINPQVIERFNAWRHTLPGVTPEAPSNPSPSQYLPQQLSTTVEDTLADQLGWITGWRIGRYANDSLQDNDSYKHQPFFTQAKEATVEEADSGRENFKKQQAIALGNRLKSPEAATNYPGPPIYEPQIDKTQLSQAAAEFKRDYRGLKREQTHWSAEITDVLLRDTIYLLNQNDEAQDHAAIREAGERRARQLFSNDRGTPSKDPLMTLVVALLDDQVHDSRAWFMHEKLKSRELWAGYFFYRMTFFGNDSSRALSPVVVAGRLLGVAMLAGATVYGIKRGGALGGVGGLVAGIGGATIGYQVIDKASGLALPFLPEAEQLLQPTLHIGQVVTGLKQQIVQDDYAQRIDRTTAMLREMGSLFELDEKVD
ncbi:T6SS phospholipase effector Tle1-like catalytic domain-containing protein [Pseudomonas baetica]|uniref:T6SS phospholipase effector Tle1-like catalytic domain-containing protein n=1 Tax=Pseudomonas baetica TaxID=674054 RepID=UPI003EEF8125